MASEPSSVHLSESPSQSYRLKNSDARRKTSFLQTLLDRNASPD